MQSADIFATLAELAGVEVPNNPLRDGVSFASTLDDPSQGIRTLLYSDGSSSLRDNATDGSAARDIRYKVIMADQTSGNTVCFDLQNDPGEGNDLVAGGGAPAMCETLKAHILETLD